MNYQVFKEKVPAKILFNLLDKICLETCKYYYVDLSAYKKMIFHQFHTEFLTAIRPYYHVSKTYYLDRKLTYNSFTNIVRQICKCSDIHIESELKYNHSKHFINYIICKNIGINEDSNVDEDSNTILNN